MKRLSGCSNKARQDKLAGWTTVPAVEERSGHLRYIRMQHGKDLTVG